MGAYCIPILRALEDLDGGGYVQAVLNRVAEKMYCTFTKADLEEICVQRRWENRAGLQRLQMVRAGLLRPDTERGYWEISEAGRKWLNLYKDSIGEIALSDDNDLQHYCPCPNCASVGGLLLTCKACGLGFCERCISEGRCPECESPDRMRHTKK